LTGGGRRKKDYLKPLRLPTTKFLAYLPRIKANGKATPSTTKGAILPKVLAVTPQTLARKSDGIEIKEVVGIFIISSFLIIDL
jgi:hypothetical protein